MNFRDNTRRHVVLNDRPNATVRPPRLAVVDRCLPAVVGHLDELLARLVDLTDQHRLRAVAVVAADVASDVDVDDVAVLSGGKAACASSAMALLARP